MAAGERPGKAIRAFLSGYETATTPAAVATAPIGISLLIASDTTGLRRWLIERRQAMDATDFVEQIAAPMAREVGDRWAKGELPVYAEHVFSDEMESVLRLTRAADASSPEQPRILLTALAGERHTLGLRMAGAVLTACGEAPLYFGTDLPANEIAAAASHYRVDVVGVTASVSYPPKLLLASLTGLRQQLPAAIQLWAGGAGTTRLPRLPENTIQVSTMQEMKACLLRLPPRCTANCSSLPHEKTDQVSPS
jgi:methylmalonyl-CoA mutase cobalamin-binding subunit